LLMTLHKVMSLWHKASADKFGSDTKLH